MLMKYNHFKKMSANEMKEVKGGVMPPLDKWVQCSSGAIFCVKASDSEEDCGPNCVIIGTCINTGTAC